MGVSYGMYKIKSLEISYLQSNGFVDIMDLKDVESLYTRSIFNNSILSD